ncbi:MAG: hypothetical protein PVI21_02925 [Candidatus Woesebacteria bacterium]|jgi:hypothetical protein
MNTVIEPKISRVYTRNSTKKGGHTDANFDKILGSEFVVLDQNGYIVYVTVTKQSTGQLAVGTNVIIPRDFFTTQFISESE